MVMAKGNDGNYFQHSLEVGVALHLAGLSASGELHLAITHGMAPFEPCGVIPNGQTSRLLNDALSAVALPASENEPSLIRAYRATKASKQNYPNTGELLAALIGRDRLSGGLTEVVAEKHAKLLEVWHGSRVIPVNASWRREVQASGALAAPQDLSTPWLFSADPMTFCQEGYADDDKLYAADVGHLKGALNGFVATGQPGVATLFVYSMRPEAQPRFWTFADQLAVDTGANILSCSVLHQGGNRNLAALLCYGTTISCVFAGITAGR